MDPNSEYESDFHDALSGIRDDLYLHQVSIYRKIEADVIAAWKEIQRIQSDIITQISKGIPGHI